MEKEIELQPEDEKHSCQPSCNSITSVQNKPTNSESLPPEILEVIGKSKIFKDRLRKEDYIKIDLLPGQEECREGIKIHVRGDIKPVRNTSTRSVPAHYHEPAMRLYTDLVEEGIIEKVPENEKCE